MPGLVRVACWEMIVLLGGLIVGALCMVLADGVHMFGVLAVKGRTDRRWSFNPIGAQMVMATLIMGMYYLLQVINQPSAGSLPNPPTGLVVVLGGSHAIYVGGKLLKAWNLLSGKRKLANSK